MHKIMLIALPLWIGTVFILSPAWSQEDMTVVNNTVFNNPQRTPSVFVHDVHNERAAISDCDECHHVYEDGELLEGESSEDQRCSDCHGLEGSQDGPSLIKAFHSNCKGCHQALSKGPIMCGECHVKQ